MPTVHPKPDEIFWRALEIDSTEEREKYLRESCGEDASLRAEVEELLAAYPKVERFLEKPAAAMGATVETPVLSERAGSVIGPYKLLQQIGEGGMGVVWMAEQERPVRRRVALKIIKPGMDSAQVVARFEAERQALAMMEHQNIARVYDAGTTDSGRPYFVMELVHGVPITKYCDDNHLTPRERLALFVPVCHAIQHAHQKGIIHRDIKPSNIMVCLYDGRPVPKIIDFGVAKATEQRLTDKTLFTHYGSIVGTFEYMSPEQSEMSQLGIDTRSDIYSLGVLLYELLTGTTPLDRSRLKSAAIDELLRIIREEEPPKPSTRLSESKEQLASLAALRKTEPGQLARLVRGDLDWIVMKCLEKDRQRRYESAVVLAKELERYLHDEPVEARPPSARYRFGKFLRKNRAAVMTTGVVAASLLLGLTVAFVGLRMRPGSVLSPEVSANSPTEAKASIARARQLMKAGKLDEADAVLRGAEELFQLPADVRSLATIWLDIGHAYARRYDYARARAAYENAVAVQLAHRDAFIGLNKAPPTNNAYWNLQWIDLDLGDYDVSRRHLKRQVDLERQFDSPWRVAHEIHLASSYFFAGHMKTCLEKFAPNIALLQASVQADQQLTHWGKELDRSYLCIFHLAGARLATDPRLRATELRAAVEAASRLSSSNALHMYVALEKRDLDAAIECNRLMFEADTDNSDTRDGSYFRRIGIQRQAHEILITALIRAGRLEDAERSTMQRAAAWKKLVPATHPIHAQYGVLYGHVLREQKKYAEAEAALKAAFGQLDNDPLTPPVRRTGALQELVALHVWTGNSAEVTRYGKLLAAATEEARGSKGNQLPIRQADPYREARSWYRLAQKSASQWQYRVALEAYDRAIYHCIAHPELFDDPADLNASQLLGQRAAICLEFGDDQRHLQDLEQAFAIAMAIWGPDAPNTHSYQAMLAGNLGWTHSDPSARVVELLNPLVSIMEESIANNHEYLRWKDMERGVLVEYHLARAARTTDPEERAKQLARADDVSREYVAKATENVFAMVARSCAAAALKDDLAAIASAEEALRIAKRACPREWLCVATLRFAVEHLCQLYLKQNRAAEAEKVLAETLEFLHETFPDAHPIHGLIRQRLGHIQRLQGDFPDARESLLESKRLLESAEVTVSARIKEIDAELSLVGAALASPTESSDKAGTP